MKPRQQERRTTGFGSECKCAFRQRMPTRSFTFRRSRPSRRHSQYTRRDRHMRLDSRCDIVHHLCLHVSVFTVCHCQSKRAMPRRQTISLSVPCRLYRNTSAPSLCVSVEFSRVKRWSVVSAWLAYFDSDTQ